MTSYLWEIRFFRYRNGTESFEGVQARNYVHNYDIITLLDRVLAEVRRDLADPTATIQVTRLIRGVEIQQ